MFGLLPAVMAWRQRESTDGGRQIKELDETGQSSGHVEMMPGGRPFLLTIGAVAVAVIVNQAVSHGALVAKAVISLMSSP